MWQSAIANEKSIAMPQREWNFGVSEWNLRACSARDDDRRIRTSARDEARADSFSDDDWIRKVRRSGSGGPWRAVARVALEEQRLTGDGGDHRGLERF
jgi:hypothetical protein